MARKLPPFPELCPGLLQEWDKKKNGDLEPNSFSAGSSQDVWWRCPDCDHSWKARVSNRARKGKGCPKCAGSIVSPDGSIKVLFPELMEEWHPDKNEGIDPATISRGSARRVWWLCQKCGNEWNSFVFSRTSKNSGCLKCSGFAPSELNCVATLYPDVAAEWHPTKNQLSPDEVTGKSGKIVWWKCGVCLHEWRAKVVNRTHLGSLCPLCSKDNAAVQAKRNKLQDLDESFVDYSYDAEESVFLRHQEIQSIFKRFLKIESESRSIESLFSPRSLHRIDYEPYYQRNYVWDAAKGTYFIESVLLGTEVPPLIFYEYSASSEVIDGRQRFETLLRFHGERLTLTIKGLTSLTSLAGETFSSIPGDLRDLFFDTKVRIIKFTVVDESRFDERLQDMIKKEIFRRYNSGITPLRRLDVERAIYIQDDPTKHFKHQFRRNKVVYEAVVRLFLPESDQLKLDDKDTHEKASQKARYLLLAAELPVMSARRRATFEQFYERFSDSITDVQQVYRDFLARLRVVISIEGYFSDRDESGNRYWFETLFWAVAVLEKEEIDIEQLKDPHWSQRLLEFYRSNSTLFDPDESPFLYRQFHMRYSTVAQFLADEFSVTSAVYVQTSQRLSLSKDASEQDFDRDVLLRIERQEAVPHSIDDICRMMLRRRFIVRPAYQRGEVINRAKSSAIIESIVLGVKLPPLYIFRRLDDTLEVIDGQQRLLSILGFAGLAFLDESGNEVRSKKDGYSLSHLRILEELNGKTFADLDAEDQDKVIDFPLSLIVIDEKFNPRFDPVDLFIRLNSRPYPIKENTFEMWNSYVDKEVIDDLKKLTERHNAWFYVTSPSRDVRMRNEELLTVIAYLEYRHTTTSKGRAVLPEFMDVFRRESTIGVRIKQKNDVTNVLHQVTIDPKVQEQFRKCVRRVDGFIKRLRTILVDRDVDDADKFAESELTSLFNIQSKRHYARRFQDIYSLWYLSQFLTQELVNERRSELKAQLRDLIAYMKTPDKAGDPDSVIDEFYARTSDFYRKYAIDQRKIRLTDDEKAELIRKQGNRCPVCGNTLFVHDETEIDHSNPLARGGKDRFLNLQIAHKHCNRKKGVK